MQRLLSSIQNCVWGTSLAWHSHWWQWIASEMAAKHAAKALHHKWCTLACTSTYLPPLTIALKHITVPFPPIFSYFWPEFTVVSLYQALICNGPYLRHAWVYLPKMRPRMRKMVEKWVKYTQFWWFSWNWLYLIQFCTKIHVLGLVLTAASMLTAMCARICRNFYLYLCIFLLLIMEICGFFVSARVTGKGIGTYMYG